MHKKPTIIPTRTLTTWYLNFSLLLTIDVTTSRHCHHCYFSPLFFQVLCRHLKFYTTKTQICQLLKIYGYACFVFTFSAYKNKLDPRGQRGVYLGHKLGIKRYLVFNFKSREILISMSFSMKIVFLLCNLLLLMIMMSILVASYMNQIHHPSLNLLHYHNLLPHTLILPLH